MKHALVLITLISLPLTAPAQQAVSTDKDRQSVSVTIYNNNMGVVRETRTLNLPKGVSDLRYEDVASAIVPQTVRVKSTDPKADLSVFEQNYEYDLISSARLMDKYIGKKVKVFRQTGDGKEELVEATLISNNSGPVYQIGNEISLGLPGRVVVSTIPENLYSKPTLIWKLNTGLAGKVPVEVSYQTNGMTWSADYVLVLTQDEKKLDMTSWVTLTNESGTRFDNVTLQLVAGEVKRVTPAPDYLNDEVYMMAKGAVRAASAPAFEQENLSDYYLYTLDQPTDLGMNQTKQVQLFSATGVSVTKRFIVRDLNLYSGPDAPTKPAMVSYEFENTGKNQLGRPLPQGTLRLFKADSKGRQQLLGEDLIRHTPDKETVKFSVGSAFDVVASGRQLKVENFRIGSGQVASYEVSLRNRKTEPVTIRYYAPVGGDWKITDSSHKFTRESSSAAWTDVPVEAGGEVTVTFSVEIKYQ